MFHTDITVHQTTDLEDFFYCSQKCIEYEEQKIASQAVGRPATEKNAQRREGRQKKEQGGTTRYTHVQTSRFSNFTSLNASRAKIQTECVNVEFKDVKPRAF